MAAPAPAMGRGRGRGRGAFKERRPGSTTETREQDHSLEQLSALVKALKVSPVDVPAVTTAIQTYGVSEERQQEAVRAVYGRCKEDWYNAESAADICNRLVMNEATGPKFRAAMLQTLQKDYKNKDELRQSDKTQFLGCLSFLCQIVSKLRDASGGPFLPLFKPTLEALSLLLGADASSEELECAAVQLVSVGECLHGHESAEAEFKKIIGLAKEAILDNRGSRTCRKTLLSVVEATASGWKIKPTVSL